jgi:hypothetical protein
LALFPPFSLLAAARETPTCYFGWQREPPVRQSFIAVVGKHMNAMRIILTVPLLTAALGGCSVTSKPVNSVLAPEQQQLGERRIYTSPTQPTPQEAVQNFMSGGTGVVPVVLIKGEKLFVQHVFDTQASLDVCMALLSARVEKAKAGREGGEPRSYYCVPIDDGHPGAPTQVSAQG